jgi:hypothetical protein
VPRRKLTQAWASKAEVLPGAERTIFWDETLKGFGLMVTVAIQAKYFPARYQVG